MNIITFNVRGLGRGLKWPAIRRLVNKQKIDMICLQETKKEVINKSMCQALWGIPTLVGKHNKQRIQQVEFYAYGVKTASS